MRERAGASDGGFLFTVLKKMISRVRRPPRGLGRDESRAMKTHTYITRSYMCVCVCVYKSYKLAYVGGGKGRYCQQETCVIILLYIDGI